MKLQWKKLLINLAIPLAVGGLSALLSGSGMEAYGQLQQPPLSPPGWVFPVVWTVLYLLMGYAAYRVQVAGKGSRELDKANILYGAQLFLNFLWSIVFFGLGWRLTAFFVLLGLWVLILLAIQVFSQIDERAGKLLIPYFLWVSFAGYLNFCAYLLNKGS
jgi:tryptophan-rich sensory protein